jgi:hypothetical protein
MVTPRRMPSLSLPLAVVGFAAGWLSDGFLANPLVGAAARNSQGVAAVSAALAGAALGAILTHHAASGRSILRLSLLVVGAGVLTGGWVGNFEDRSPLSALSGALNGAISGAAFIPVAALVLAAARRAQRARQGSIVAGADRRAVWSILAAALSVTTLAAALDVPLARYEPAGRPFPAGLAMAGAAALLIAAVLVADAVALGRVVRLGRADSEPREAPPEASAASALPSIDLGLGGEVRAELGRARSAYRDGDRAVGLLVGSVAEARGALIRALVRGGVGLAIAAAVLSGHRWAETPAALVAYETQRCARSAEACFRAGMVLARVEVPGSCAPPLRLDDDEQRARPFDPARGEELLGKACAEGFACGCTAQVQSRRARAVEDSVVRP